MKRKKAGRKTRKTPAVTAKPLRPPYTISSIGRTLVRDPVKAGFRPAVPADFAGQRFNFPNLPPSAMEVVERSASGEEKPVRLQIVPTKTVYGIPLPPDFEEAVEHYTREVFSWARGAVLGDHGTMPEHWELIRGAMEQCFREGFYLALVHHSRDLKANAVASPLLEGLRDAARRGAAARRKQAEPNRKAVCKRFREMRKTTPKKTVRYLRIAEEFGMSERHVQRIVNEADLD